MRGAIPASSSNPDRNSEEEEDERRLASSGGGGGGGESSAAARDYAARSRGFRRLSVGAHFVQGGAVAALPESILEAVAREAAASCAREQGPLAAGRALASIFQVCANWRAVSRSEFLWESAFGAVWTAASRQANRSWRQNYIRAHATASNIHHGRSRHTILSFDSMNSSNNNENSSICRCLAITNRYLAGGFFDGTVRIFDLSTKSCIRSIRSGREDRFGLFSRAVSGIVLRDEDDQIVFASLDGSVFLGNIHREQQHQQQAARLVPVHVGNIIEDGALISFAGSSRWWVGLYAGSPGRSFRIWDATSQRVLYSGGDATNADAMQGWHSFVAQAVRMRLSVYELDQVFEADDNFEPIVNRAEPNIAVAAMDVEADKLLSASHDGVALVRLLPSMMQLCRVQLADDHQGMQQQQQQQQHQQQFFGTLNSRQLFLCISGAVNAWDVSSGAQLYSFDEQLGDVYDLVASDTCLAACVADSGLHLWDFSP